MPRIRAIDIIAIPGLGEEADREFSLDIFAEEMRDEKRPADDPERVEFVRQVELFRSLS
jgi:hypothetical protein